MLAYTAWDSLRTIARQYDADIKIVSGDHVALAPHRARCAATAVRPVAARIVAGITGFFAAVGSIVS